MHIVRESVWFWVVNVSALPLSSCQVVLPLCLSSFSSNWHGPTAATLKALAQPEISSAKRQRLMLNRSPQRWLLSHQEGVILSVCLLTPTKLAYSFSQCPCYPKKANKAVGHRAKWMPRFIQSPMSSEVNRKMGRLLYRNGGRKKHVDNFYPFIYSKYINFWNKMYFDIFS